MRRTLLSWPVEAMAIAVLAIGASGAAWAQPSDLLAQQSANVAMAELEWIPAGSVPIPPKPKACEDRGNAGVDEYPTGAPIIPPKPKAVVWVDDSTALPAGGLIIPPKPKSTIQY